MQNLTIYWVEKEWAAQEHHLFDLLFSSCPSQEINYNIKISAVDKDNYIFRGYLPTLTIDETEYLPSNDLNDIREKLIGAAINVVNGKELSKEEKELFLKGDDKMKVGNYRGRFFFIEAFNLDLKEKNEKIIEWYKKKIKKLPSFKESKGNFNYIEGGYDIDAAFDGSTEAYWNID